MGSCPDTDIDPNTPYITLPYIMYHFSTENLDLNSSVSLNSCITNSLFLLPFYLKTNGFCEGKTLFALFRK